jgi:Fe-S-cluster containining protein
MSMLTPSFFSKPLLFACNQCGECCRQMQVPLNHFDLARLQASHPNESLSQWVRFVPIEAEDPDAFRFENGWRQLCLRNLGPEKGCIFLKENGCSIYAYRPTACQTWPLDLNRKGKLEISPAQHLLYTTACDKTPLSQTREIKQAIRQNSQEFEAYRRLLKQWNLQVAHQTERQNWQNFWDFLRPFSEQQEHSI